MILRWKVTFTFENQMLCHLFSFVIGAKWFINYFKSVQIWFSFPMSCNNCCKLSVIGIFMFTFALLMERTICITLHCGNSSTDSASPVFFCSMQTDVVCVLLYIISSWPSLIAPLTSLSANSLPWILMCTLTHPKWIIQFRSVNRRILFLIS